MDVKWDGGRWDAGGRQGIYLYGSESVMFSDMDGFTCHVVSIPLVYVFVCFVHFVFVFWCVRKRRLELYKPRKPMSLL